MKKVLVRRIKVRRGGISGVSKHQTGIRLKTDEIQKNFSPKILDLGDLSKPWDEIEAITAILDLTGFTRFCNQVDAYLAVPRYLNDFLEWFFDSIRKGLTEYRQNGSTYLWADLPIMVKFLGDGMLLLWNARNVKESQACHIVTTLYEVCNDYRKRFYPEMTLSVNKPPATLRCGIARGKVFSVGDGRDYIGHCINNASRLLNLGELSFCFPHHGFRVREEMSQDYARLFVPKYVNIRGVGEEEMVWVVAKEFDNLPAKEKAMFRNVDNIFV